MSTRAKQRADAAYHSLTARAAGIIRRERFRSMRGFVQHGDTSCYTHCLAVAYYSLLICNRLNIRCDRASLVRGALLHDYFLYDWHDKRGGHRLHGFRHPAAALDNAAAEYALNAVERNIILRHMFPLVPMLPRYRESYIVCIADKFCSALETLRLTRYSKFYSEYKDRSIV